MATKLATLTVNEVSGAIQDVTINAGAKKVLEGLLNDFMDLQYGVASPYTTGKQILPTDVTVEDLEKAITDEGTEKKFKDVYKRIYDTYKSGDLTPQSPNNGWDIKLMPVLVVVTPNN